MRLRRDYSNLRELRSILNFQFLLALQSGDIRVYDQVLKYNALWIISRDEDIGSQLFTIGALGILERVYGCFGRCTSADVVSPYDLRPMHSYIPGCPGQPWHIYQAPQNHHVR